MVSQKSIGLLDRRLKILAGLQSRPAGVRSRLVPRKTRAASQRCPCPWSETDVCTRLTPAADRALHAFKGKDAQVQLYHVRPPGQTGKCSPSRFGSPSRPPAMG